MNRKDLFNYILADVLPQINEEVRWTADIVEIAKKISKWRIGKPVDVKMNAVVEDGALYINGDVIGRIAAKMPRVAYDEGAAYWEGRILARQEY